MSHPLLGTSPVPPALTPTRRFPWWVLLGAVLLPCLYLPTLATRFDFIDDGNLVYPAPPMSPVQRVELVWQKIVANYRDLGPFRPVLWVHWETAADLFRANPVYWRAARLAWSALAAGVPADAAAADAGGPLHSLQTELAPGTVHDRAVAGPAAADAGRDRRGRQPRFCRPGTGPGGARPGRGPLPRREGSRGVGG